jgi:hypothetical protein
VTNGREKWKAAGGQVVKLPEAEQDQLMKQLAIVGTRVTEKNPQEKAMFEILRAAAERTK